MSSRTLRKPAKKTESAPKSSSSSNTLLLVLFVFLSLAIFAALGAVIATRGGPGCIQIPDNNSFDEATDSPRRVSGPKFDCLQLIRVSSPEDVKKGLSGRESLSQDMGMLFTFENPGKHCFWMKDMQFPIDIIWVNEAKKVISVQENVQPDTYPDSFCPSEPAKYVIEVNSGLSRRAYLSPGSQLQF